MALPHRKRLSFTRLPRISSCLAKRIQNSFPPHPRTATMRLNLSAVCNRLLCTAGFHASSSSAKVTSVRIPVNLEGVYLLFHKPFLFSPGFSPILLRTITPSFALVSNTNPNPTPRQVTYSNLTLWFIRAAIRSCPTPDQPISLTFANSNSPTAAYVAYRLILNTTAFASHMRVS